MRLRWLPLLILLAAGPASAGDLHATWVKAGAVRLERVLPPPPRAGSPDARADIAAVEGAVAARTEADERRIDAMKPCTAVAFARGILGPGFTSARVPLTVALVERAFEDTELAVLAAKRAVNRPRPYALDPHLATYGRRSPSASYPSGHAACGRVMAIILAAIFPSKADALFARAALYGRNREMAGTHFPSDLVAGETAGSVVADALFRNSRFRRDLVRAAAEAKLAVR